MASKKYGSLYTGVSIDLLKRVYEHRSEIHGDGFTNKYDCKLIVYYEILGDINGAIKREKQIKAGSGNKKLRLIDAMNPDWHDLYSQIIRY